MPLTCAKSRHICKSFPFAKPRMIKSVSCDITVRCSIDRAAEQLNYMAISD